MTRMLNNIYSGANIPTDRIKDDAITETKIADDSIDTPHLKANIVTAAKINVVGLDGTSGKIILSQIESGDLDNIDDGTTYGKVALTGITAGKIIVAGLDSGVTARMFLDSTTKTNIEAWRHLFDTDWSDGNNILWSDSNNIVWQQSDIIDLTLIDGGDIYAGTITVNQIAAGAITAAKLTITDLVDIANLLTVASGKIVIGAGAIGAGLDGIKINDGTYDRVAIGEVSADTYGLTVKDSSGNITINLGTRRDAWSKIYDDVLTAAATTITISSGLAGNTDFMYYMVVHIKNAFAGVNTFHMRINNDSGANYGWQTVYCTGTGATGATHSVQTEWVIGTVDALNEVMQMALTLHAKSGQARIGNALLARRITGTTVDVTDAVGYVWNNTADEITRFDFFGDETLDLGIGTHIIIYKVPSY